ncbi:MAG: hypothetical protein AB7O62_11230 [Pirellulales bacterium]
MNVTYTCPHCSQPTRADLAARELSCLRCGGRSRVPSDALDGQKVKRCVACPSIDLFARKDFPQKVGVTLVVLGFAASCLAWYQHRIYLTFAILFATALIDLVLYLWVGNSLVCYRCGAEYRGVDTDETHGPFSLETHERYRQQAARLEQQATATRD